MKRRTRTIKKKKMARKARTTRKTKARKVCTKGVFDSVVGVGNCESEIVSRIAIESARLYCVPESAVSAELRARGWLTKSSSWSLHARIRTGGPRFRHGVVHYRCLEESAPYCKDPAAL